jgi:hypothetical protein
MGSERKRSEMIRRERKWCDPVRRAFPFHCPRTSNVPLKRWGLGERECMRPSDDWVLPPGTCLSLRPYGEGVRKPMPGGIICSRRWLGALATSLPLLSPPPKGLRRGRGTLFGGLTAEGERDSVTPVSGASGSSMAGGRRRGSGLPAMRPTAGIAGPCAEMLM